MSFPLAFVMGFSVASIPGPILILVATETLRRGTRAGMLIMMAPPLIDALVMVPLALLLHSSLLSDKSGLGLGLIGSALLLWLGWQSIRAGRAGADLEPDQSAVLPWHKKEIPPFLKGVLTHLTNPYPYLYWATVGGGFVLRGFEAGGAWGGFSFPLGFWIGASAFNLSIVYLLGHGRRMLPARMEPVLHRFSGLLLIGCGLFLAAAVWRGLS